MAAAGVLGVIKVLLSMKYRSLPPSINFEKANRHIDFETSPFYVHTEHKAWEVPAGMPRRAAVSSFGFSGTNAHVVLEEYIQMGKGRGGKGETKAPYLIVLSAKNEERLKEAARNLYSFTLDPLPFTLSDLAYTLQVGRAAMEERKAWVVEGKDDLMKKLKGWLEGGREEGGYQGNSQEHKNHFVLEGAAGRGFMEIALREKEWGNLARLWTNGVRIDWDLLYGGGKPSRISLPTYPFARERYGIDSMTVKMGDEKEAPALSRELPEEKEPTELLTYRESWEEKPWREGVPATAPVTVLYFAAPGEAESDLSVMRGKGPEENFIVRICEGPTFEKVSETDYRLPRNRDGAYQDLFDAFVVFGKRWNRGDLSLGGGEERRRHPGNLSFAACH